MKKLVALFLISLSLFFVTGCFNEEEYALSRIYELSRIIIPETAVIEFHSRGKEAMNGRRRQYTVFSFEEITEEYWLSHNFKYGTNDVFESSFTGSLKTDFNERLGNVIPCEYQVDWDEKYLWFETEVNSGVYFVYLKSNNRLIFYVTGT